MSKKIVKRLKPSLTDITSENLSPVENSYLLEMSFNSNIDEDIRKEIERKFKKSTVNAQYVFPRNFTGSENRRKRSPVKTRSQGRPKLLMEKSLPVLHKISKSIQDSTNILNNLVSMKKIHRSISNTRNVKDSKIKITASSRFTPLLTHNRSSSHYSKRTNTPLLKRGENALEGSAKRTKFRHKREESKKAIYEGTSTRTKLALKKPGHFYTVSMESVVPSSIIKSVAYY